MNHNVDYPIISADGHVDEPEDLISRLPTNLRERVQLGFTPTEGGMVVNLLGFEFFVPELTRELTQEELKREFRQDPKLEIHRQSSADPVL